MQAIAPIETHHLDEFRNHLNPEINAPLTPTKQERMAQYRFIIGHLTAGNTTFQTVKALHTQYQLTDSTAYRRIQEAFQIFGDYTRAEKDAKRIIYIESLEKTYFQLLQDAQYASEYKEKVALLTTADSCMKTLIKLQELDKTTNLLKTGKQAPPVVKVSFIVGPAPSSPPPIDIPHIEL